MKSKSKEINADSGKQINKGTPELRKKLRKTNLKTTDKKILSSKKAKTAFIATVISFLFNYNSIAVDLSLQINML